MRIRCGATFTLFQCSRYTIAVGRIRTATYMNVMRVSWNRRSQTMSSSLFWSEIWRKSYESIEHFTQYVSFSPFRFFFFFLFFIVSTVFDGVFVFHSRMLHTLRLRCTHICVGVIQLCTIVADVGCVSPFQFSSTKSNEWSAKKTFRFCFPIPNHKPTDSAASTHTLTPTRTHKLKNPHIYPHPILPQLRLAQMLFCRTSFTFCLWTFFILCVCLCVYLHSIFHFTFHSTLPVLLVSTTSENFVLFHFTTAINLSECVCVCVSSLLCSSVLSSFLQTLSFYFHYRNFIFSLFCFSLFARL